MVVVVEKSHLTRLMPRTLPEVVVSDQQFGELAVGVVSLLDVVNAGGGDELDAGRIVQLPDELVIVIREQELALYLHKRIPKAYVVFFSESVLADVFVVALGCVVGWVTIEKAHRAVILPDELLEVLVLYDNLCQSSMRLLDQREVRAHIVGLTAEAVEAGCVAETNELIKPCRSLNVRSGAVTRKGISHQLEVLTGVENVLQFRHQFPRLIPHAAVKVGQQAVEVVVDLEIVAGWLSEENPPASAEHLDIAFIVEREHRQDGVTQRLFPADPAHKAVQASSPPFSGRQSWVVSKCASACSRPRIAALIPAILCFIWAIVRRSSSSVSA